jgi:SP family general alpha glucoside:H+ symporter-like MFS transporter
MGVPETTDTVDAVSPTMEEPFDIIASEKGNVIIVNQETRRITSLEHKLTVFEALKTYPKIVLWACFIMIPLIGVQYDETVMGAYYALPAFQKRYGIYVGPTKSGALEYIIEARWQSAIGMAGYLGQIFGALGVASFPLDRYGPRRTLACAVFGVGICIFIQFFAQSIETIFVGELFQGLISGCFIVVCVSYASEISPLALRGILSSTANLFAVCGQFIGTGVTFAFEKRPDEWSYRIPFAIQWWWIILFLGLIYWAPESPYWLVRKDREEEAIAVMKRLSGHVDSDTDAVERVSMIRETNQLEKEFSETTTFLDCFRGSNLRRTEIVVVAYIAQVWGGAALEGYSTFFFELAGLASSHAFALSLGSKAFAFCGTVLSWWIISKFGRRTLYCSGEVLLTIFVFLVGVLDVQKNYSTRIGLQYGQALMLYLFAFVYDCSIGPVEYVLLGEISSTRMRSKTIAVALALKAITGIIGSTTFPFMMDSNKANWRGKAGFLYAGLNAIFTCWAFMRIPETKGRTYEEIDMLFERGVRAKDFSKYRSNADSDSATSMEDA